MPKEYPEDLARWEARRRMNDALEKIEQAQSLVDDACRLLCPLTPLSNDWARVGKLYDRIKAEWHRMNLLRNGDHFTLDPDASERIERKATPQDREWLRQHWAKK